MPEISLEQNDALELLSPQSESIVDGNEVLEAEEEEEQNTVEIQQENINPKEEVPIEENSETSEVSQQYSYILMEHCYARPRNWRPETSFLRPTKTLFIPQRATKKKSTNPLAPLQETEDVIDVLSEPVEPPSIYDYDKAKQLMSECERYAACTRIDQGNEDWEESISKVNWTPAQSRLFNGIVNILSADHMARLAYAGSHNEPILRRTVIDKSVKRLRHLMATIAWDPKLTQWLHQLLIENLSTSYLSVYLDILQTLKSKLPTFVDKMMYFQNANSRIGVLSNESLFPLLKRPWDPVASSLNQDKPKKLPGNPIIIVVPTTPNTATHMKRQNKWHNLLTNLGTVQAVYSNIGQSAYRLTMMNCMDQMLAATRAKVQEVKTDHPGRPIVLAGFNAGAALALQVAQIEPVLCVLCLGFSLLTAEGKRGDPDDNLLELQCPVLFVIGQCSHTSLQEDMEDLRERMRVETGLIVVGSADDYLRVSKKKKKSEGITQSVVDRCIVDEVGEFVSGLLLSPYPPQIRQSPTHVPPEALKRAKADRKRNNSNCSSLDSEPPSPTPRITRPGQNNTISPNLGRPPGSKSKSKLEAKWAQQVAQGTPSTLSPSCSPPPTPNSATSDTPLNENSNPPSIADSSKGSKTLTSNPEKHVKTTNNTSTPTSPSAKMQAMGLVNRSVMPSNTLSTLLQSGVRTIPASIPQKPTNSGIKVLENLTLNSNSTAKLVSSTGRTIDLSKITVLNSVNPPKPGSSYGNVILMPDGKIKTAGSVKGLSNTPLLLPINKTKSPPSSNSSAPSSRLTKYITSKKQLMGNKPPKPIKKIPYLPASLPPPTNLTSQDIMDLPIIFADDNQMLANNVILPNDSPAPQILAQGQSIKTTTPGKFVFVNKQLSMQAASAGLVSQATLKRPTTTSTQPTKGAPSNAVKYAKIILSKRIPTEDGSKSGTSNIITKISSLPSEISVKKVEPAPFENIDLESELVATAVPKPNINKPEVKNVTLIYKKNPEVAKPVENQQKPQTILNDTLGKRTATQAEIMENEDDSDFLPAKSYKIESC